MSCFQKAFSVAISRECYPLSDHIFLLDRMDIYSCLSRVISLSLNWKDMDLQMDHPLDKELA